jgi:ketosteroid isomerase-like protein
MNRRVFLSGTAFVVATLLGGGHVLAGQGAAAASAASKDEADVRRAEAERFAAMVKADVTALDKLLAPDLTYTHGDARVIDKTAFIADFKSGAFQYVSIEPNDMKVRVFGDTAIVTGGAAMRIIQNGTPASIKIRYTDVHVKHGGVWQMAAWEATRVP